MTASERERVEREVQRLGGPMLMLREEVDAFVALILRERAAAFEAAAKAIVEHANTRPTPPYVETRLLLGERYKEPMLVRPEFFVLDQLAAPIRTLAAQERA